MYIGCMNEPHDILPDRVAFIADAHLGKPGDDPSRADALVSFLRASRGRYSHLYIVGDLFDFWFEYRSVVPNTTPHVIFELYNLVQAGTNVVLFGGNHDYWYGLYMTRDVGVDLEPDGRVVTHQGRRLFIHHGDGFYPGDHGYRIMKKVFRSRTAIWLFSLLHPDFASKIARITSKTSRTYLTPSDFMERNKHSFQAIADRHLAAHHDCDAVVYGHAHVPLIEERDGGTLVILGDWIVHNTYVELEHGRFTLRSWDGRHHESLTPIA